MKVAKSLLVVGALLAGGQSLTVWAQGGTAGAASVMVIPVVAQTGSYTTEVFVRNNQATPITLNVRFYEALTSSVPGQRPCAQLVLPGTAVLPFTLASQCTLGAGPNHGMLILEDAAPQKTNTFFAYSRTQTPSGNGFSVEAYPIGTFSGEIGGALGLKRQSAAPTYQTNCFVAALGEPLNYSIQLRDGSNLDAQIGNTVAGSLNAYEMRRYLDIFSVAGLPPGDYSNIRARFQNTSNNGAQLVGLCTVQESTFFGADFRLARSIEGQDNRQRRYICFGQSTCGTADGSQNINNVANKNIHWTILTPPDYVKCEIAGSNAGELEIQVRGPGDTFLAPVWPSSPPYSSGGDNQTSFYIFTGHRNETNNGVATRWFIDVGRREGSTMAAPIPYGITCYAGNGLSAPWQRAAVADDF
jgi:hypothetical protein